MMGRERWDREMPPGREGGNLIAAVGHGTCGPQSFLWRDEAGQSKGGCFLLPVAVDPQHQSCCESSCCFESFIWPSERVSKGL